MSDEKEVNSLSSGTEEVSSNIEKDGVVEGPATGSADGTPASPIILKCKECGVGFERQSVAQKFCPKCKPGRAKVHRTSQKQRKSAASTQWNSTVEIKPKEARRILEKERGITNPRVLDVCVEHALYAARNLKIPYNASLFKKGLQGTLAAARGETPPSIPADEWHAGERVREHELFAEYDYACSWRVQPDGSFLSFDDWKACRRRCITDLVWFANTALGKSFEEEPHGRWARELFPQLETALLSLPEKFGQKDIAKAFRLISDVRQRCLISARSSFKSTFSTTFMCQIMLAFAGSVRIMVCTATQPLARGFAKAFRSLMTLRDPNNATLMNQLWPEHCIAPDDGKALEYTSPFRQLDSLIEPTLGILSVISEGAAGMRYDYGNFDDCAEISNSSTPEMRAKTQERIDMLRELGEPHSLTTYIGTPISQGAGTEEDPGDLYSVLLRREAKNQREGNDPKLLYTICPAWTVNPSVKKRAWDPTLREDEVTLLFPSRFSFAYLMAKLKENLATDRTAKIFRQQSLVSWVPDTEEDWKVTFERSDLDERVRSASYFNSHSSLAQKILGLDRAYSISKYADRSCLLLASKQLVKQKDGQFKNALVFTDCRTDRWRESDLIRNVCEMIDQHRPQIFVAEQDKNWQEVWDQVRQFCVNRGIVAPYFRWKTIVTTDRAFARRAKMMEAPISDGRIWWVDADWTDGVLKEFENFDGIHSSNSHRKDDSVACASLIHQECGVKYHEEVKPEDAEKQKQQAEIEFEAARRRDMQNRMWGTSVNAPRPSEQPPPEPQAKPRTSFPRAGNFAQLPSGMRTFKR
jgi:hypothetical protein